jgi:hypothetical protein
MSVDEMRADLDQMLARAEAVYLTLNQDEHWRSADGEVWRLEEMADSHRRNLIAWLERRARRLGELAYWGPLNVIRSYPRESRSDLDEFDPDMEPLEDPVGYVHRCPLYRRLRELSPEIPDPEIRPTGLRPRHHQEVTECRS